MFKKVLVLDDIDSINIGVKSTLKKLGISHVDLEGYCDNAYLKIRKAQQDNQPYDLLISDLSFIKDYREQKYTSGEKLIEAVKGAQPSIKIIVYSIEEKHQKIKRLINTFGVNAYVCKGRKGLDELSNALKYTSENKLYLSPQIESALRKNNSLEITDFDVTILNYLSLGKSQTEISLLLQQNNTTPSSLSSIEKRLNLLKDQFKASNTTHLIAVSKDLNLI